MIERTSKYLRHTSPAVLLNWLGVESPEDLYIEAIAQACGATVRYEPLEGCEARLVGFGERAIITVDEKASRARQRFSIAHELGHWMFDRGKVAACGETQFSDWGQATAERRANKFAAELLLPKALFKKRAHFSDLNFKKIKNVSESFQTSLTATAIRLVELSPITVVLASYGLEGRKWFVSSHLAKNLTPVAKPRNGTTAFHFMHYFPKVTDNDFTPNLSGVNLDHWFESSQDFQGHSVWEDSIHIRHNNVLSLLKVETPSQGSS